MLNKSKHDVSKQNKDAWDAVADVHWHHLKKNAEILYLPKEEKDKLRKIGIKKKSVIQLCCNNGRELLAIKKLGAGRCVGIDFSKHVIEIAKNLAQKKRLPCEFFVADALSPPKQLLYRFDITYISAGTLDWLHDLNRFFLVCQKLLKKNGIVFIHEMHPLLQALNPQPKAQGIIVDRPYFYHGLTQHADAIKYFPGTYPRLPRQYCRHHTMSEVIDTAVKNFFTIEEFEERPEDISWSFRQLENKKYPLPLSYFLLLRKK